MSRAKRSITLAIIISGLMLISHQSVLSNAPKTVTRATKTKKAAITSKKKRANLVDKLTAIAQKVGMDPDQIEWVRYAIKNPEHFATIVNHGVSQDYPFFALIGAVKIARRVNKNFTQQQCNLPITIINEVFSKADSTIDDAKGKQDTNAVIDAAKQYAADYAKAQTASAKQELIAELAKYIPYFSEIPVICSAAFETNLSIERNLQKQITEKVKNFRLLYYALAKGNYVDAVAILSQLGASTDLACDFIDQAISGGLIGRTPILGALAKGACKNFTGKIFDAATGIIKGGVGYAEDGVKALANLGGKLGCEIYSWFGEGCSSAPPSLLQQTLTASNSWCSARGGMKNFSSKVPGQDVSFSCNDGSACRKNQGGPMYCQTSEERAAWQAQRSKRLQNEILLTLPADAFEIRVRHRTRCPFNDKTCVADVNAVVDEAVSAIKNLAAVDPAGLYSFIRYVPFRQAEQKAQTIVHEADFRVRPQRWTADFKEKWLDRCKGSKQCNDKVTFARNLVTTSIKLKHQQNPKLPHSAMSVIYAEGEMAVVSYFKTAFQEDKTEDDAARKNAIRRAVLDATGREANPIEIIGYTIMLNKGEKNINGVYLDAVAQMNKFPKTRAEMIVRGYLAALGREPKPNELQFWQPRPESFKDFIAISRNYLYSPNGAKDLNETVRRFLSTKGITRPSVDQVDTKIAQFAKAKVIFREMQ
jgi:hypothetical protein